MKTADLLKNLEIPKGKIDVVLDTDAYNEVDDQFAIAYMLKHEDKFNVKALYAAPFFNARSTGPADGMEKSYQEIFKVLALLKKEVPVFRGSTGYLPDDKTPVDSPAAKHLGELAMGYSTEKPLYVVAIGAITNVASAILLKPEIADKIVIVWLGGHALHWPSTDEFNMMQDYAAARVTMGCGAPFVILPCRGVVSAFTVTEAELRHWLLGKNELCTYLAQNVIDAQQKRADMPWNRCLWDVTAVAWLIDEKFTKSYLIPSPIAEDDGKYATDPTRHPIRYVYSISCDPLKDDFYKTLTK